MCSLSSSTSTPRFVSDVLPDRNNEFLRGYEQFVKESISLKNTPDQLRKPHILV